MSSHISSSAPSESSIGVAAATDELERRQDEVLLRLDELESQILALIQEFSCRLDAEADAA